MSLSTRPLEQLPDAGAVLAHFHVGEPVRGCTAACGFAFPPVSIQCPSDVCADCLRVLAEDRPEPCRGCA